MRTPAAAATTQSSMKAFPPVNPNKVCEFPGCTVLADGYHGHLSKASPPAADVLVITHYCNLHLGQILG